VLYPGIGGLDGTREMPRLFKSLSRNLLHLKLEVEFLIIDHDQRKWIRPQATLYGAFSQKYDEKEKGYRDR